MKLTVIYTCRNCKQDFSKQDYEENMFCRNCQTLLSPKIANYKSLQKPDKEIGNRATKNSANDEAVTDKDKMALMRAAESLRNRVSNSKEYSVISEETEDRENIAMAPQFSWMWYEKYQAAHKLKVKLTRKFKGKHLEDAIPGKVVSNEQGKCYAISTVCVSNFKKASYEESKRLLLSDLKLIPGIGPVRESILRQQGYKTIEDLEGNLLWRKQAQKLLNIMEARDIVVIQNWLWRRLPKSHPLAHYLAGLCDDKDFAIIDIETLGLSERPIVLLGVAKPSPSNVLVSQFLLRDIQDEPSAIWALISQIEPKTALITFNGRSFDIPYIRQRLAYYGLDAPLNNPHFDLLHFTRRAFKEKLPNCRLDTIEKSLGIHRDINIPGALVPDFYDTYLKTRNVGPLVAIVEHNKQDLITLGSLFSRLYEEWHL
jgi:uncharacterized protein YprB with RNaseH-like and TPR domain/DNA-directed RNA polymerase subunit RPC12/RpoP